MLFVSGCQAKQAAEQKATPLQISRIKRTSRARRTRRTWTRRCRTWSLRRLPPLPPRAAITGATKRGRTRTDTGTQSRYEMHLSAVTSFFGISHTSGNNHMRACECIDCYWFVLILKDKILFSSRWRRQQFYLLVISVTVTLSSLLYSILLVARVVIATVVITTEVLQQFMWFILLRCILSNLSEAKMVTCAVANDSLRQRSETSAWLFSLFLSFSSDSCENAEPIFARVLLLFRSDSIWDTRSVYPKHAIFLASAVSDDTLINMRHHRSYAVSSEIIINVSQLAQM